MGKYFPYGVVGPSTIPDVADRILDEFFGIVNELDVRACLAYGLCLGFVRDGGYIVSDNDFDIVIADPWVTQISKLGAKLTERGFKVETCYAPPSDNIHFHKERILIDIFFRYKGAFYAKFDRVEYKDRKYPIPSPVEGYLEAVYDKDWRIPSNMAGKCGV